MDHGKVSTYTNGKCRCNDCREALRLYNRDLRTRYYALRTLVGGRLVAPGHPAQHGTRVWYERRGCRCVPCMDAHRAYQANCRRAS